MGPELSVLQNGNCPKSQQRRKEKEKRPLLNSDTEVYHAVFSVLRTWLVKKRETDHVCRIQ